MAACDTEAIFALAGFASADAEGAAVVFFAHFGAVEDELHFGAAFAGTLAALDGAPGVVVRQGHVVVKDAAAAVDDLDDGLVIIEADVAVVFHVQLGLVFFFHQFDLDVVDIDVGHAPASERERGADLAFAGTAAFGKARIFIPVKTGNAVDRHGSDAVGTRSDVHNEAIVGPFAVGEGAEGVGVIHRVEAVAVDNVASFVCDGVDHEPIPEAMHDLGFLHDLHAAGELHVIVGCVGLGVRNGIVGDGFKRITLGAVEAHAKIAVVISHVVRAVALPQRVLAGHGFAGRQAFEVVI